MRPLVLRLVTVTAVLAASAATGVPGGVLAAASGDPDLQVSAHRVRFREQVVSSPVRGGGYPGAAPAPGRCVAGRYDSNFSEGSLALRPGTERLVGASKAFFGRWSTFKSSHTVTFSFGAGQPRTHFLGGFDCATRGTQAMPPSWTNVTDPTLAWDGRGRVHQLVLPFNAFWGSVERPNGNVHSMYSDDGGRTWRRGNGGRALEVGPDPDVNSSTFLDKPWIAANPSRHGPRAGHLYGAWVLFTDTGAEIHTAVSRDRGATWTTPQTLATRVPLGPKNPWPMLAVGPRGVVYLSYVSYGAVSADGRSVPATLWSARSRDDGRTWTGTRKVATTRVVATSTLPRTTLHRTIVQYLAASPDRPGHLYLVWNRLRRGDVDVMLTSSRDGGRTWSPARMVNDDQGRQHQFSATVDAGTRGAVAVAYYDLGRRCPRNDPAILPRHRGDGGTCIGLTLRPYRDRGRGLVPSRASLLVSRHLWDPYQPAGTRRGIRQLPCEDAMPSCDDIFLGDYFSMQVSRSRVYLLSASTHPRSSVRDDEGRPLHYQQQLLTTVRRSVLGLGR
jgi:hypothetical protein